MELSRLLGQLRFAIRAHGFGRRTEAAYVRCVKQFVSFNGDNIPAQLDRDTLAAFLEHVANEIDARTATRIKAESALRFAYRHVLLKGRVPAPRVACRAYEPVQLPLVLTPLDARRVFDELPNPHRIVVSVMYGCGLRLIEALQLRFGDIDLERREILVRGRRGRRRIVPLPDAVVEGLTRQLARIREIHSLDRSRDAGWVTMPGRLARRYPRGLRQLVWQYVFPAVRCHTDPLSGRECRHHLHETAIQRALRRAVRRARIGKHVTCHTFRHSYAMHLLEHGYDLRTIQELMGHHSVRSTRLYCRLIGARRCAVRGPLDSL